MLEAGTVERFLARLPGHVVLVLDEAYYEFAAHFAALARNYVFELARLCSPGRERGGAANFFKSLWTCRTARRLRPGPGGVAGILRAHAQHFFCLVGGASRRAGGARRPHCTFDALQRTMRCSRSFSIEGLSALGYRVVPTSANFVFCDLGEDAASVADRLQDEGVAVRPLGHWGAPNCIRVTIGTGQQNQEFLNAMRRLTGNFDGNQGISPVLEPRNNY